MKRTRIRELAEKIAGDLFTNGFGQEGERLVLELPGKRDGGGWCKRAAIERIEKQLLEAILIT